VTERFQMLDFDEVVALGLEEPQEESMWSDHKYRCYVVEFANEGPKILGSDGGEPEDQRLYRDWAWVVPALNKAYHTARSD